MGHQKHPEDRERVIVETLNDKLPSPSASYRRRAWVQFQRALDPLAQIKPLPPPRP